MTTKKPIKKPTKSKGGRPKALTDPEKVQQIIDDYFAECDNTLIVKQHPHSKGITRVKSPTPYTMAGLARALGISRETLNQYKKEEPFSDIIMRARDRVHESNVSLALLGCHDSRIAALNLASNFGYQTKEQVDQNIKADLTIKVVKYDEADCRSDNP